MLLTAIITTTLAGRCKKMTKNHNHLKTSLIAGFSALLLALSACGERLSSHGHAIDAYELEDIIVGETTKSDILFTLGKPSFEGAFNSGKIYYVSQNMVLPAGGRKETVTREIFTFLFDENDLLQDIIVTDEDTGIEIAKLSAKTPTPGADFGILDQIFANIRRRNSN